MRSLFAEHITVDAVSARAAEHNRRGLVTGACTEVVKCRVGRTSPPIRLFGGSKARWHGGDHSARIVGVAVLEYRVLQGHYEDGACLSPMNPPGPAPGSC